MPKIPRRTIRNGTIVLMQRNRYDVKFYFTNGSNLRWFSDRLKHIEPADMVKTLREIADTIERAIHAG